ncbi:AraC family transcriptional regulator [Hoyosella sp. YIM 151337]|uniref:AraC family transcriptional regulator n=1 Tax=Hoyosella sp. YIM 151337 TaxID=2992742 RepID=UPI002235C983|nr:AraC family transcriptional regulator [Hoyosella sp. YIM 151337]MCW4353625.1 AraC family transcriptional regulator [Hoyosella sp. YIM 151337]
MRQHQIRAIPYRPPAGPAQHGIEIVTLRALRAKAGISEFSDPQCPRFHLLSYVTSGTGTHTIDFTSYQLQPGTVWWVRPGQVQQWGDVGSYEATMVLFEERALGSAAAYFPAEQRRYRSLWPQPATEPPPIRELFEHMRWVFEHSNPKLPDLTAATLRSALAATVLTLAGIEPESPRTVGGARDALVEAFTSLVEANFAETRAVTDYARLLGYSEKTLTRAIRGATGLTPKSYIAERVTLEAKRLLAYTELTATRIAVELGFSDTSNFTKFFASRTGTSPAEFRATLTRTGTARTPAVS